MATPLAARFGRPWIGGRKARFSLLTVGDDRGPGCLELLDRLPDRVFVEAIEALPRDAAGVELSDAFEELERPGNAPDRFSRNRNVAHGFSPPRTRWAVKDLSEF
jgi:hypothetical protein